MIHEVMPSWYATRAPKRLARSLQRVAAISGKAQGLSAGARHRVFHWPSGWYAVQS